MAAVEVLYAETITDLTTIDSSDGYLNGASIASGSFTAGDTYLIIAQVLTSTTSATLETKARLQHGSTTFPDGERFIEGGGAGANAGWQHVWLHVFTQPGGGAEAITLATASSSTDDVTDHHSSIVAINLSDLVQNTDWWENEVTVDYTNTTTFVDQANVTLTANGTDTYLVIAHAVVNVNDVTNQCEAQLEDSVAGVVGQLWSVEGEDATNETAKDAGPLIWAYVPAAGSHNIAIQTRDEAGTANTVLSSRIVVLRLNAFRQFFAGTTVAELALSASFQTAETESVTPDVTGTWFYLGACSHDAGGVTNEIKLRLQDDDDGSLGSDPNYGDDQPQDWSYDATDEGTFFLQKAKTLTAGGSRTINFDVQANAAAGAAEDRILVGFSAELPAGADALLAKRRSAQAARPLGSRATYG